MEQKMKRNKENLLTALEMSLENIAVEAQLGRPHNVEKLKKDILELVEGIIESEAAYNLYGKGLAAPSEEKE